ncbi:RluA family pseudouridine synthase [Sporosarcina sp. Marseille-Q4063]|uniref:RluA family pseudouridine synthase n=1 Tax=Sporosarcina sp. Marseille-Q4063 TaxID=2810514 RepID=UPI001BB037FF|nr:RluA family pseudouridine synthase [Sporosarcina sp. Marseille-Q4063]QUW21640.1 RluA family pseudouridine synthase [Sporosarcina sp. Marseille-Q4063]
MNRNDEWIVKEQTELLKYLYEVLSNRSRNSVKGILARGQVLVNGKVSTQFNDPLNPGDQVQIHARVATNEVKMTGVTILHEDNDLIVIEKEPGLLSIASEDEKHLTAYRQLTEYVRSVSPKNRIFVVHRLDRDTSGVMVFAKNKEAQQTLQNSWQESVRERAYIALVEGAVKKDGTVTSWLTENKMFMVYSSPRPNDGKKAITHYKVLQSNRNFSLLQVNLDTGRKNQIRVHMQDIGHPVVGDKKYGSRNNTIGRLGLHANAIELKHPTTGESMRFESKTPTSFTRPFNK